jgi:predicted Zn-dependent protease
MSTLKRKSRKTTSAKTDNPDVAMAASSASDFSQYHMDMEDLMPPLPEMVEPSTRDNGLQPNITKKTVLETMLPRFYSLNVGCYLVKFSPIGTNYHYDGTIRVQKEGTNTIASGDLYYHKPLSIWPLSPTLVVNRDKSDPRQDLTLALFGEPSPANGIPIFSRGNYRYYLRITQILESLSLSKTFTLGFERWKFNGASASPMWTNEGLFKADMTFTTAPAGYPSGADYLTGEVKNSAGTIVGNLTMGWVAQYLRKATVEIDRVSNSEAPLDSGAGHNWQNTFDKVGWKIDVVQSSSNVTEVSGDSWSDGEMHAAMLSWRNAVNLDSEWRFHILAVNEIDSTPRGIMYDAYASDSNNVPREGIGIATHWMIPNTSTWGKVKGQRFGAAKAPYFRTALHELGHAMGLYHNTADFGIMNTTDVIAAGAVSPTQFPDNVKWEHAADDQKKLRHMPDIFVRPGGVPFGTSYSLHPLSPNDEQEEATGLELAVTALRDVLPIGAPARFEISLKNISSELLPVPVSISMKSGNVKGKVIDPSGNVRTFTPLVICVDDHPLRYLGPGEQIKDSLTLLRGAEGALFTAPGVYTVEVEASWDMSDGHVGTSGRTTVYITSAENNAHARAAMDVLSTPDTLLSLAITGDHLDEGNKAIQTALDNEVLRPHYAFIEAKRLAQPFGRRKADIKAAATLLKEDTVMSNGEIKKAAKLLKKANDVVDEYSFKDVSSVLKVLAKKSNVKDESLEETIASIEA